MSDYILDNENDLMHSPKIKVIGVGGGGGNAVHHMLNYKISGVEFICVNTDVQALQRVSQEIKVLQIGDEHTRGLGAGSDPKIGEESALSSAEEIEKLLEDADMVFITAGMGGGTGTGAAPVVAELAKKKGILTIAVVTKPFPFEGNRRMKIANTGINKLVKNVDSMITIPNSKLLSELDKDISFIDAFSKANDVLMGAVDGITSLINRPGMINVDFADVKAVMSSYNSLAMIGSAKVDYSSDNVIIEATEKSINNPLMEEVNLKGATGILINFTVPTKVSLSKINEAASMIKDLASDDALIIFGMSEPLESSQNEIRVTVIATGLGADGIQDNWETRFDQPSVDRYKSKEYNIGDYVSKNKDEDINKENISKDQKEEDNIAKNMDKDNKVEDQDEDIKKYLQDKEDEYNLDEAPSFIDRLNKK